MNEEQSPGAKVQDWTEARAGDKRMEYGQEYYASGLGPLPYERSEHWLNFFSVIADEIIRTLHPKRVLDAGCAMGFLVEAFWDRGVYSEGIDISEYAISKVRPDIRQYCSVRSITSPIDAKFDLITCIEVLEHLPPESLRVAVENLTSAADLVLFSSTPDDFTEPTHLSVRPSIFWLQLFSEFGFWPDVRFDACFVTPHAILFKRTRPPEDDLLRLFSEFVRYKMAVATRTVEIRRLQTDLSNANFARDSALQQLTTSNDAIRAEMQRQIGGRELRLAETQRDLEQAKAKIAELVSQSRHLALTIEEMKGEAARRLATEEEIQQKLQQQLMSREAEHGRSQAEVDRLRIDYDELIDLRQQMQTLTVDLQTLSRERTEAETTLNLVLASRAWRLAEKCRTPLRTLRGVRQRLERPFRLAKQTPAQDAGPVEHGAESQTRSEPALKAHDAQQQLPKAFDSDYQSWIDDYEPNEEILSEQRNFAIPFDAPIISIIVPVYQPQYEMLKECLESVSQQTYERWELCIAMAPGGDARNSQFVKALANRDNRVRFIELQQNGGISRNTNAALELGTGEFIALLDHDDTLAPFALYEVARHLERQPETDILYSDHDYLDADHGLRWAPLFKPEWSPEIMLSANYISHLTVLRRTLVEEAGRFDSTTDGAQDWDLFFRITEKTNRISHISQVLYHWRMHPGSTAHNDSSKNYAADAQLLAIRRHMERIGLNAAPEVMPDGLLHAKLRETPSGLISIIIPTKDKVDLLSRCISSILELTRHEHFEILIVDNGSREEATKEYLRNIAKETQVQVIWHPGPFNYSAINNRAAHVAKGEFLLFLNNDVEIVSPDWLHELASWADYGPVGIVGAKLLHSDRTIQHAGVVLGMSGFADHPFAGEPALTFNIAGSTGWYRDFLAVTGACMMMRRTVFDELGGFDEKFTLCGSDVEICLRAYVRGYRVVYNPFAELIHREAQTRGVDVPPEDYVESFKHYQRWLANGDPFWNTNLSLWNRRPSFRKRNEESSLSFVERHVNTIKATLPASSQTHSPSEEDRMVRWFDCTEEQFRYLREQNNLINGFRDVKRLLWFIPAFEVPFYGGIYTILRFSEYWKRTHGVDSFFAICGSSDCDAMTSRIRMVYSGLQDGHVFILNEVHGAAELPEMDASICTLWTTAYYAIHHRRTGRRFYFIQDFEPAFYRAGSGSALVESTYRMGLYGIANTVSLKHMYESEYGGKAIYFKPCINDAVFYVTEPGNRLDAQRPLQVFCYGRPHHPRNAFELVNEAMQHLKNKLGNRVRIVSAGEEWKPSEYGLQGVVENLGILTYEDTARLYRESDVGVVMMLTRHPSYIPLELMASGCLVVSNKNSWTSWLLKDGENCLLAPTTASALAETIERGLLDGELRETITANALSIVRSQYLDWTSQMQLVYEYLCNPEGYLSGNVNESERQLKHHNWSELSDSGERVSPEHPDDIFMAHLSIYDFASRDTSGKNVLDAGCGTGYGTNHLLVTGKAAFVVGIDASADSIRYCNSHYSALPLKFVQAELGGIRGIDGCFDYIFCSNVLEHVFNIDTGLLQLSRALKKSGRMLIAVPPVVSEAHLKSSFNNPYHVNNFHPIQWFAKLSRFFESVKSYKHEPKLGVRLNFSDGKPSIYSPKDFLIEEVPSANLYEALCSALTAIFILEGPRNEPLPITETEERFPMSWDIRSLWLAAEEGRRKVFSSLGRAAEYSDSGLRKRIYPICIYN